MVTSLLHTYRFSGVIFQVPVTGYVVEVRSFVVIETPYQRILIAEESMVVVTFILFITFA